MNMHQSVIYNVFKNIGFSTERIVESFESKCGLGGDNGREQISFPESQDEYSIVHEGWEVIPVGIVEITYWDGEEKSLRITEKEYKSYLHGYITNEAKDKKLLKKLESITPRKNDGL